MRIITTFLIILLVLLGLTFAGLNAEPVTINYYIGTQRLPLSLLLVIALACGGLLGLLTNIVFCIKLKSANMLLKHRLRLAEEEVVNLRTMPLKDQH